jgi:hypothetical protein
MGMILKESSLKVIVGEIVYAVRVSRRFRTCATRYLEYDSFHHIYSDLADIFENFGVSFLAILLFEGDFEVAAKRMKAGRYTSS